jgi:NAD-dependent DNA ligase
MGFFSRFGTRPAPAQYPPITLNEHGQPTEPRLNWRRIADRQIDELIGMCRMAIGDGAVDSAEAKTLLSWLESNRQATDRWPANVLHERLARILADGKIDEDEERELLEVLAQVTGGPVEESLAKMSTSLPFCRPVPRIDFEDRVFCLTGQFCYGPRRFCQDAITQRGGIIATSPSRKIHFLVVGLIGSSEWLHSTHGRKIEKAVELREEGTPVHIVSEEHWVKALTRG